MRQSPVVVAYPILSQKTGTLGASKRRTPLANARGKSRTRGSRKCSLLRLLPRQALLRFRGALPCCCCSCCVPFSCSPAVLMPRVIVTTATSMLLMSFFVGHGLPGLPAHYRRSAKRARRRRRQFVVLAFPLLPRWVRAWQLRSGLLSPALASTLAVRILLPLSPSLHWLVLLQEPYLMLLLFLTSLCADEPEPIVEIPEEEAAPVQDDGKLWSCAVCTFENTPL
jgi:hypothetical protein